MAMASSLALLHNTPASALASGLFVAAPTPLLVANFCYRRRISPAFGQIRTQMEKRKRTDMDTAWDSSSGLASMMAMASSLALLHNTPASALASGLFVAAPTPLLVAHFCYRRRSSPALGQIRTLMARRKRTDMDEAWDSSSGLASMIVAGASCFWRHCSAPLELPRAMSSHQQMAELKRKDLEEMSLRDSFSQSVSSMLVAGLCAAAAFGWSTSHFGVAYAAEGPTEESSTNFQRSCAGCHAGGGNILQPNATLFAKDLDRNGMANSDDIFQITYFGKGRMPGYGEKCTPRGQCTFGSRLSDSDIRALAEFVRVQADQGWTVK